jgi:hypothetical protein
MSTPELEAAYRRTHYVVRLPSGELILRVDRHDAVAETRMCEEAGVRREWAVVTPCNPASRPLDDADNRQRLLELQRELELAGYSWFPAVNRDPQQAWPDEPGVLLADVPRPAAVALGRQWDQTAIVAARLGHAPELVWL